MPSSRAVTSYSSTQESTVAVHPRKKVLLRCTQRTAKQGITDVHPYVMCIHICDVYPYVMCIRTTTAVKK